MSLRNGDVRGEAVFSVHASNRLDLTFTNFAAEVDFRDAALPGYKKNEDEDDIPDDGTLLDETRFNGALFMSSSQFYEGPWWNRGARIHAEDRQVWRVLEKAFERAGDLGGKNGATYELQCRDGKGSVISIASRLTWGFGLKPLRLAGWLALTILAFAAIYFTQTQALAKHAGVAEEKTLADTIIGAHRQNPPVALGKCRQIIESASERLRRVSELIPRWRFAIRYSVNNAFNVKYDGSMALTRAFKWIRFTQWALSKLLIVLLLIALSNTSPLLHSILGKLFSL